MQKDTSRRHTTQRWLAGLVLAALAGSALAQGAYPSKPVRMVSVSPAGSTGDARPAAAAAAMQSKYPPRYAIRVFTWAFPPAFVSHSTSSAERAGGFRPAKAKTL